MRKILIGICLLLMVGGCSGRGGTVTLQSQHGEELSLSFSQAYMTQTRAGEYDIVLVDNAADWDYGKGKRKRPLEPVTLAPIRQVMHIHTHWRPLAGTRRNPAAINASINWYVLGPDGSEDKIVYEGAGFVILSGKGQNRQISIREGFVEPKTRTGNLQDPIGRASISGEANVRMNNTRVQETVAEMRE